MRLVGSGIGNDTSENTGQGKAQRKERELHDDCYGDSIVLIFVGLAFRIFNVFRSSKINMEPFLRISTPFYTLSCIKSIN